MPDENKVIGIEQLSEYDALIKNYIATHGGSYVLSPATESQLGGVIVGKGLRCWTEVGGAERGLIWNKIGDFGLMSNYRHTNYNSEVTKPTIIGEWYPNYDLYMCAFKINEHYDYASGSYGLNKVLISGVKDIVSCDIKVSIGGKIVNFFDLSGFELFNYGGSVGINIENFSPPTNDTYVDICGILYYTAVKDDDITDISLYSGNHYTPFTINGVTITPRHDDIHISGTPTVDTMLYSEYEGHTGTGYLPALDIKTVPRFSFFKSATYTGPDAPAYLYDSNGNEVASNWFYDVPSVGMDARVKGSDLGEVTVSHVGIRLVAGRPYNNYFAPMVKTKSEYYSGEPTVITQPEI